MKKSEFCKSLIILQILLAICLEGLYANKGISKNGLLTQNDSLKYIVVDAGEDAVICQGSSVYLIATANNYYYLLWTTSGNGTFSDPSILNPIYHPTPEETGIVELCLTAYDNNSQVTDCMELTIIPFPTVNAGVDTTICSEEWGTFQADVIVYNYSWLYWYTTGDGFFDNEYIEDPVYYVGFMDLIIGSTELCVEASPIDPCVTSVTDCMTLYLSQPPMAYCGDNATICFSDTYFLNEAFATDYNSVEWSSSGDGTFNNTSTLNPIYYPGTIDKLLGGVELCLTCTPLFAGNCSNVIDCLFLTIVADPNIEPEAPLKLECEFYDFENHEWLPIPMNPVVNDGEIFQWATNGDGVFSDPTAQNTNYELGPLYDRWSGTVTLTLTVWGPGSCGGEVSEDFIIYVPQQIIPIEGGTNWRGISSYIDKGTSSVVEVMEPVVLVPGSQSLVIMKDVFGDFYWPEVNPGINFIGNWESIGYLAKFKAEGCLPIYGDTPYDTTAHNFLVEPGMTYLPVLTNQTVNCNTFFDNYKDEILLVYSHLDGGLWVPGFPSTLEFLYPGQAYMLITKEDAVPFELTFPALDFSFKGASEIIYKYPNHTKVKTQKSSSSLEIYASHWNLIAPRRFSAISMIKSDSIAGINSMHGMDSIGLFNSSGDCAGTTVYTFDSVPFLAQNESNEVYAGFPGFLPGEPIEMHYYQPESNREFILNYQYENFFSNNREKQNVAYFEENGFGQFSNLSYQKELQRINIPGGWSGISSYLLTEAFLFDSIVSTIDSSVIIASNQEGVFWPAQNINTIGEWDTHSGYVIKLENNVELQMLGHMDPNQSLSLSQGWSIIPVLTTYDVSTTEILSQMPQELVLIKEVAGWRVFWPDLNITSLENLKPGKAYYMLVNNETEIDFSSCSKSITPNKAAKPNYEVPGWKTFESTPISHIIGIDSKALSDGDNIENGDIIGAFDNEGNCWGMQKISPTNTSLIVFGDDITTEAKDGFYDLEEINFRLYGTSNYESYDLAITFSMQYPDYDRKFKQNGLSVIKNANIVSQGIFELNINLILDVNPVPAQNEIVLSALLNTSDSYYLKFITTHGTLVKTLPLEQTKGLIEKKIDISNLEQGAYFVQLSTESGTIKGKAAFIKTN